MESTWRLESAWCLESTWRDVPARGESARRNVPARRVFDDGGSVNKFYRVVPTPLPFPPLWIWTSARMQEMDPEA